ncbi:MAG: DinB family protein [Chloroflexi bacterium]|nr:DinB family protein [Chloroflexota bacterium]
MEWFEVLAGRAPDPVAAWLGIEAEKFISVRREVRRRAGEGTADGLARQLAGLADALSEIVRELPEAAFLAPGGEGDWNVAQAIGHDADARAGLAMAGALAAQGRFPPEGRTVVPGVPGAPDAARDALIHRIELSQRIVERAARSIGGHETDPCPLVHPLVGRLRCGEWLLFAGVHDLMHLEQLHDIRATFEGEGEGEGEDEGAGEGEGEGVRP